MNRRPAPGRLPTQPIALAGFMGAGKSTVGRVLADLLERPFDDTDAEVERRTGRTVPSFFPDAEAEFRRLEAEVVAGLLGQGPSVIALGGGALLDENSRRRLREEAILVHLHLPWEELEAQVAGMAPTRPLLRGRSPADIHELYLARLPLYREAAIEVEVDRTGPEAAAAAVLAALLVR